jgi:hypothetical protein
MADTVDSVVLLSGKNRYAVRLTNISDGTGESAVVKIDKSALIGPDGTEPGRIVIEQIDASIQGFTSIRLHWDHTTDDEIAVLGTGSTNYAQRSEGIEDRTGKRAQLCAHSPTAAARISFRQRQPSGPSRA